MKLRFNPFSSSSSEPMPTLPPIYCITLPEEPWKGRLAERHFVELGITARFVHGIQGVTIGLKPTNPYDYVDDGSPRYLHPASVGCILSHRLALTVAITDGAQEFIIVEDDVEFIPGFAQRWPEWRAALPEDADVVQLEYCCHEDKPTEPHESAPVARCFYPFCAACIWWRRDAAIEALALLRPIDRSYDIMLIQRVFPFLSHYIALPQLASQRSNHTWPSSIDNAPK